MARLFKTKQNIDRMLRDIDNNLFRITEAHSGFVWLSSGRGMKQIGKEELKFYKEKRR